MQFKCNFRHSPLRTVSSSLFSVICSSTIQQTATVTKSQYCSVSKMSLNYLFSTYNSLVQIVIRPKTTITPASTVEQYHRLQESPGSEVRGRHDGTKWQRQSHQHAEHRWEIDVTTETATYQCVSDKDWDIQCEGQSVVQKRLIWVSASSRTKGTLARSLASSASHTALLYCVYTEHRHHHRQSHSQP